MRLPPAIVLPANTSGYALLNCLRLARIPAIVLGYTRKAHEMQSRFPRKLVLEPGADPQAALLPALDTLRPGGGVILPSTDSQVLMLSRHRESLERDFALCAPSDALATALIDKELESDAARAAGLTLPPTVKNLPQDAAELSRMLGTSIILKPKLPKSGYRMKTYLAESPEQLAGIYDRLAGRLDGLIAQAHVPGGPETLWLCNCVFNHDHELVSAFTYHKLRTKPVRNGVTTVGVSRWNPELVEQARAFGRALGFVGPADLEFKRDPATGTYYYIETNPRFTLSCEFAARCGVNQVEQAYRIALGERLAPAVARSREGVYYVNAAVDIKARRREGESWPRIARDWLGLSAKPKIGVVSFSLDDPWPFTRRSALLAVRASLLPPRWLYYRTRSILRRLLRLPKRRP